MASTGILRVGIVGYGVVGRRRRAVIDEHPRLNTVAVSDQKLTNRVDATGVKYFGSFEEIFSEELDVLFVSLPNYLAPRATILGLETGLHVFCEKPPGRNVADIRKVIEVEKRNPDLKLKYGFNHRYHHSVQEALDVVKKGELGGIVNLRGVYGKSKIVNFESEWRTDRAKAGGGILLDQGIHMLDLMRLFAGEFVQIHSFISNSYWHHEVEDNAYALMKTEANIVALIHSSATQWRHQFCLDIALERGAITLSGILSGSKSYGDEEIIIVKRNETDIGVMPEERKRFLEDTSWEDEVRDFELSIKNGQKITQGSSLDALRTMELVEKIYQSDSSWSQRFPQEPNSR